MPGVLTSMLSSAGGSVASGLGTALSTGIGALLSGQNPFKALGNWFNGATGSGLTDAQKEQNEFNAQQAALQRAFSAQEASKLRDWQERMRSTQYQTSVNDMKLAGLNPAMAYGGTAISAGTPSGAMGSGSAASGGTPQLHGGLMADIMNLSMLNAQRRNIEAQTRKLNEEAERTRQETAYQRLLNEYYPGISQATIDELRSRAGLQSVDADYKNAQKHLVETQNAIAEVERQNKQRYMDAEIANMTAQERASNARAFVDEVEGAYMNKFGARMSSSDLINLIATVMDKFFPSLFPEDATNPGGLTDDQVAEKEKVLNDLIEKARERGDSTRADRHSIELKALHDGPYRSSELKNPLQIWFGKKK